MKSNSESVKEFTVGAGQTVSETPELMSKEEVFFLAKMILDETMELCATVANSIEVKLELIKMITNSRDLNLDYENLPKNEIIGEQADAVVDMWYYGLNAAVKKGVDLSEIFEVVHGANMAKRDPKTGKFLKRDDGKIVKPEGWKAPDIAAEIERQFLKNHNYS